MKPPCSAWSARSWPKPAKNGKPEKLTSTWNPKPSPLFDTQQFYRKKLAPPAAFSALPAVLPRFQKLAPQKIGQFDSGLVPVWLRANLLP
jgi:hypothetical protein